MVMGGAFSCMNMSGLFRAWLSRYESSKVIIFRFGNIC